MRNTHLIFIEGIMGSGKTTTAEFLTEQLRGSGIAARFLPEGPTVDEPEHPLRVATTLPHPRAVWRDVTIEEFIDLSLGKWRSFAREARRSGAVTVVDGLLFHGNMTDLLLMGAEPLVLHRYVARLIESIRHPAPVLIYFRNADIARALHAVCAERGPEWESYQVSWKVGSPYGERNDLPPGFDGLTTLYQRYSAICDDLYEQLRIPKLAVRGEGDWGAAYRDILAFLQLPSANIVGSGQRGGGRAGDEGEG